MAINTKIATDIAYKRLAGNKSFTNPTITPIGELIGSNIQSSADIIFGENLPTNPGPTSASANLFNTSSNAAGVGVVQLIEFDLIAIASSIYDADSTGFGSTTGGAYDEADSGATSTTHSFALHFPSTYEANDGSNSNSVSQNAKAGTGFFQNSLALTGSGGSVQIVPALYGANYTPSVFNAAGTNLQVGSSAQDFYLDTFAGVLTRQDGDNSSDQVPSKVRAYVYIGKMISESMGESTTPTLESVTAVGNTTTQGITITGSLVASSSLVDFSGATNVSASLFTASAVLIENAADINGALTVEGGTTLNTLNVTGNTTIDGDLTVGGTTTTISTANLLVEDQFILLGSSSNATLDGTRDGGIIVARKNIAPSDSGIYGTALLYDASRQAWGITGATGSYTLTDSGQVGEDATTFDSLVNITTVEMQSGFPTSAGGNITRGKPLHGKDEYAYGQMFVDTTDDINGGLYIFLPE